MVTIICKYPTIYKDSNTSVRLKKSSTNRRNVDSRPIFQLTEFCSLHDYNRPNMEQLVFKCKSHNLHQGTKLDGNLSTSNKWSVFWGSGTISNESMISPRQRYMLLVVHINQFDPPRFPVEFLRSPQPASRCRSVHGAVARHPREADGSHHWLLGGRPPGKGRTKWWWNCRLNIGTS